MWPEVLFLSLQAALLAGEQEQGNTVCSFMNVTAQHPQSLKVWPKAPSLPSPGMVQTDCRFCHAISVGSTIVSQGCWLSGEGCSTTCGLRKLLADTRLEVSRHGVPDTDDRHSTSRHEELSGSGAEEMSGVSGQQSLSFCCCSGDLCNSRPVEVEGGPVTRHHVVSRVEKTPVSTPSLTESEMVLLVALILLLLLLGVVSMLLLIQTRAQAARAELSLHGGLVGQKTGLQGLLGSKRSDQCEDMQPLLVGLDVRDLLFTVDKERV